MEVWFLPATRHNYVQTDVKESSVGLRSGRENSQNVALKIKFVGGIFLGHQGPRRRELPDKNFMQVAFFCCFRQGVAGMSRDLGRDVPDLEKPNAKELWADVSFPIRGHGNMLKISAKLIGGVYLIAGFLRVVASQPF